MGPAFTPQSEWTGLLLAGGRSARMGQDKAFIAVDDIESSTLITAAHNLLTSCCAQVTQLGGAPLSSSTTANRNFLEDKQAYQGPKQALVDALPQIETPWLIVIPVDMPGLTPDFLFRMMAHASSALDQETPGLFALDSAGRDCFPICLRLNGCHEIAQGFADGPRSLFRTLRTLSLKAWTPTPGQCIPGEDSLRNLNTPEDLAAWRQAIAQTRKRA